MTVQEKARCALEAREHHDPRFDFLVAMLSAVAGLPQSVVIHNIEMLAK